MTWTYELISGRLYSDSGELVGKGYSGDPEHTNNPNATSLKDQGPIPMGTYRIGPPQDTVTHGPFVLPLEPDPSNLMWGRSGFLIHGDSVAKPGTASQGCIIMARGVREEVWSSGDRTLDVVAQIPSDTITEGA